MTDQPQKRAIVVSVNGTIHHRDVSTRMLLSDFLRHELELTGTHVGCEHGVCGACTVLLNGRSARSCMMLAVQCDNEKITTVEGIAAAGKIPHPLQEAFRQHHALQCGFCTAGMLTTLTELLSDNPNPTEREVEIAISGNLCRCTGYKAIVAAALDAAETLRNANAPTLV